MCASSAFIVTENKLQKGLTQGGKGLRNQRAAAEPRGTGNRSTGTHSATGSTRGSGSSTDGGLLHKRERAAAAGIRPHKQSLLLKPSAREVREAPAFLGLGQV